MELMNNPQSHLFPSSMQIICGTTPRFLIISFSTPFLADSRLLCITYNTYISFQWHIKCIARCISFKFISDISSDISQGVGLLHLKHTRPGSTNCIFVCMCTQWTMHCLFTSAALVVDIIKVTVFQCAKLF